MNAARTLAMWREPLNRRENPVTRRSALASAICELRNPVSGLRERVRGHTIAIAVANQSNRTSRASKRLSAPSMGATSPNL